MGESGGAEVPQDKITYSHIYICVYPPWGKPPVKTCLTQLIGATATITTATATLTSTAATGTAG